MELLKFSVIANTEFIG